MYQNFFNLTAAPFSIAPDPHYLYLSMRHREALAHLMYGTTHAGGIVVLTGEVGTGKTTLCRCLLQQVPEATEVALIVNPKLTAHELLATVCDELSIRYDKRKKSIKLLIDAINRHLLISHAEGRHTVVLIDEAQQLAPDVLEQLRLMTNLETNDKKLLQIVLLGQPELNHLLAQPHLRQLAQRITARYHLQSLSYSDSVAYIRHRLSVVGGSATLFGGMALCSLYRHADGVPRLMNVIADRALLGAYSQGSSKVGLRHVRQAVAEIGAPAPARGGAKPSDMPHMMWLMGLLLAVGLLLGSQWSAVLQLWQGILSIHIVFGSS
ncbi:MAG: AAA family ATPase [Mariprofundales bacterium]